MARAGSQLRRTCVDVGPARDCQARIQGGGLGDVPGLAGMALLHDPGLCAGRIAQLVEQLTLNQRVPGSSPGAPTNQIKRLDLVVPKAGKN